MSLATNTGKMIIMIQPFSTTLAVTSKSQMVG